MSAEYAASALRCASLDRQSTRNLNKLLLFLRVEFSVHQFEDELAECQDIAAKASKARIAKMTVAFIERLAEIGADEDVKPLEQAGESSAGDGPFEKSAGQDDAAAFKTGQPLDQNGREVLCLRGQRPPVSVQEWPWPREVEYGGPLLQPMPNYGRYIGWRSKYLMLGACVRNDASCSIMPDCVIASIYAL